MNKLNIHEVIGIGIGPFNLGMAALLEEQNIDALFFDESPSFNWHPGMLIEGSDLQVPFLADLVTFADPTSRFSFLNYLHTQKRLFSFYFFNRFDIPRREYNNYAQWVAGQLSNCHFGKSVIDIIDRPDDRPPCYEVVIEDRETKKQQHFHTKNVVVGTGTKPMVPKDLEKHLGDGVFHSSQYQYVVDELEESDSILIAGSGQSAAEIFLDQLQNQRSKPFLHWLTRSSGFFQLEAGKLGQEVFSPDYIDYFHELPFEKRKNELPNLSQLRNGVEESTLHQIYDLLYHRSVHPQELSVHIQANTEVVDIEKIDKQYKVYCFQRQQDKSFDLTVDKVVLATGYKPHIPDWFEKFRELIEWEDTNRFAVTRDYQLVFKKHRSHQIYTLSNLEHSHGPGATNLALSVLRNITIINRIVGHELYPEQQGGVFQQFGLKKDEEAK
ncbi:lysine N(6)-hydroxylase/L-ornithine N(5)-oxygenase family protein [Salipaludibacillus daqingensis]|uniref:lysine N(6)-hydroxylase/L-ornithine N(5)-oxygenase family protein n=1 Tax=Salipaludibacillus daqingensis TaxID=3041001 RepID=UPI002475E514|nr:SidA/IucD/PvdA family monooxygenase [Salipaludibacillus daqingensis]